MSAALIGVLAAAGLFALFGLFVAGGDRAGTCGAESGDAGGCGACGLAGACTSKQLHADDSGRTASVAERSGT